MKNRYRNLLRSLRLIFFLEKSIEYYIAEIILLAGKHYNKDKITVALGRFNVNNRFNVTILQF